MRTNLPEIIAALSDRKERRFPIQNSLAQEWRAGIRPGPPGIPWSVAEKAYSVYAAKYGRSQTLERLSERGGFSLGEMDEFYSPWREETSRIFELEGLCNNLEAEAEKHKARITQLKESLAQSQRAFCLSSVNGPVHD